MIVLSICRHAVNLDCPIECDYPSTFLDECIFMNSAKMLAILAIFLSSSIANAQTPARPWRNADVASALERSGKNRAELEKALAEVPEAQRSGMVFLIENM